MHFSIIYCVRGTPYPLSNDHIRDQDGKFLTYWNIIQQIEETLSQNSPFTIVPPIMNGVL